MKDKKEPPKSCASCSHYPVCWVLRDVVDIVAGAPANFAENDQNNKSLLSDVYLAFGKKCHQYKKG